MDVLVNSLQTEWENLLRLTPRLAAALILFLALLWAGRLAARAVVAVLSRGRFTSTHKQFFRKLTIWLFVGLGAILVLNLLGLRGLAASLVAGGGLTAVVLGFALREIGENFLAGLFLAFSRPFEVGDLIESGALLGTVRGIELRYTHVRTADGRDIFIPSSKIFKDPLVNFTRDGLRRPSFKVGIDYGDDAGAARQRLLEAVQRVEGVLRDPAPGVLISALIPQYVELEVYFWVDTSGQGPALMNVRSDVMDACRRTLRESGFTVSSEITTNLALSSQPPLEVRLAEATG